MIDLSKYFSFESLPSFDLSSFATKVSPEAKKVAIVAAAALGLCVLAKVFCEISAFSSNPVPTKYMPMSNVNNLYKTDYTNPFYKKTNTNFLKDREIVGQTLDRKYVTRADLKNIPAPTLDWL